jgi:hypothetical protein
MRWVLLRRLNCEYSGGKKTQMRGSYSRTCIPLSDFSLQHGTALCTIFASLERLAAAKHGYPAAPRKCYEGCTEVLIPRINAMHRYSPLALSPAAVVPVI